MEVLLLPLTIKKAAKFSDVSILVLMEVLLLHEEHVDNYYYIYLVSILVLMEVLLLRMLRNGRANESDCFNPCFNGSPAVTNGVEFYQKVG